MASKVYGLLLLLVACSWAQKTLVLVDDFAVKETHSMFFKSLEDRGHTLKFAEAIDEEIVLEKFGEYFYDNLVIFSPQTEDFGEKYGVEGIVKFIDSGRNVMIAVHNNISEPVRQIASECGVDFDQSETSVVDHFNYDASDADGFHTIFGTTNWAQSLPLVGSNLLKKDAAPLLYEGVGMATAHSNLIFPVLRANPTSFSHSPYEPVKTYPQSTGTDALLVVAVQTRNNARVVFSGSIDMFNNEYFTSSVDVAGKKFSKSSNEEFSNHLTQWVFDKRGHLRAGPFKHKVATKPGAPLNPSSYRVGDEIDFEVLLEEYSPSAKAWVPFLADDVQLELVMVDPYIRTTLPHDSKGVYAKRFMVPDVYGVYKFIIRYSKPGYSNLMVEQQITIHPYRHDEFERFIDTAFPYYVSAFTLMAGFFVFGLVFLYGKETVDKAPENKPKSD